MPMRAQSSIWVEPSPLGKSALKLMKIQAYPMSDWELTPWRERLISDCESRRLIACHGDCPIYMCPTSVYSKGMNSTCLFVLQALMAYYERCGHYYSHGGWGSLGAASEAEKRITMVLFLGILDSLAQRVSLILHLTLTLRRSIFIFDTSEKCDLCKHYKFNICIKGANAPISMFHEKKS